MAAPSSTLAPEPTVGLFTACTRCSLLIERLVPCDTCEGDGFVYALIDAIGGAPRTSAPCEDCAGRGRVPARGLCARCEALEEDAIAWAESDRKERT